MPTLLMGHGQVLTDQSIKVPPGYRISFLIDESRTMPFASGVGLVLNISSLQQEGFSLSSSHGPGDEIHNHRISVLSNDQRMWYAQVDPEDGSCWYAGESFPDEVRLCENPDGCNANEDGSHDCIGLFGLGIFSDTDLYWVSCRQNADPNSYSTAQASFGNESGGRLAKTEYAEFAHSVAARLRDDPDGFAAYFDPLPDEEKAMAMTQTPVKRWSFQREAKAWLAGSTTDEQFFAFVNGQDDVTQGHYLADGELRAAFDRGRFVRQARDYLESRGAANFLLYVNGLDPSARALLAPYPELAAAMDAGGGDPTGPDAQRARFGITVDEIDWSMVQGVSEAALKGAPNHGQVPFWQLPTGEVAVGAEQPDTYRKLIELVRDGNPEPTGRNPNGQIVVTKGSIGSKGKLEVTGASDERQMKSWLERFSDKKITFA